MLNLKSRLVQRMRARSVSDADRTAKSEDEKAGGIYAHYARVDTLPGYKQLQVQASAADHLGIENPYFRAHEGIAGATTMIDGREYLNFSSYNYLDLNGHPAVLKAAGDAMSRYGTSVSASRPVSGERPVQRDLERALAKLHGTEDCVVMVSGHATNVTCVGQLFGRRDLILHDALIHNSVVQGALLSGAERMSFAHNDWHALDELLRIHRHRYERVLIALEGLYSMDGDYPDLPRFVEIKNRYGAWLLLDEAHSVGVLGARGAGLAEHYALPPDAVELHMGTLSKTLSACGGYIAGARELIEYLKFSAPGFVYSVGVAPPLAAAASAALEIMQTEPQRGERLRNNGAHFLACAQNNGLDTASSAGLSVIPVICGSSLRAVKLSLALFAQGINVQPIIFPAVEERRARLRFFMSSAHTTEQLDHAATAVAAELRQLS
ncbi:MAG: aminotransferase class I/II-fold pyridoxal phosphate-dependent enzyme [Chromatiales bacterium]|jgi:8-amino-7-oxononanoate synthase|nr:aminotransferase class I/II-fold pyridoxal phosphate-dependent enzyme [Chromatiales bacterium]